MLKKINVLILMLLLCLTYVNIVPINLKAEETDTFSPEIPSVSADPDTVGYGFNITIAPSVTDNMSGVNLVKVNITFPDNSTGNFTMNNTGNSTYEYVFSDTWIVGQYNYTIWAIDNANNTNVSSQYSFNVSAQAVISVCTIKDEYGDNETVNLTDPSGDPHLIGYEFLDGGDVLHIWNKYNSYYFNTSSGIQLTNHYNKYWSHNVLMLGYYNNENWNLIYRTDELSGFNKDIISDDETYVNATLWEDLTYEGYNFRLAIRYHLGVDDTELTVITYVKNLGDAIPYNLGFAWEINNIQIDMTQTDDYIEINRTTYDLYETLDLTFKNMTVPIYCWNDTTNETYICGYQPIPYFYIREDLSESTSESLYLRWDPTLDYRVKVKSRDGEYNAPVTLAFKIGTLNVGQEKYTEMFWHDASEITYYFNSYNEEEAWATSPGNMVDGSTSNYASTSSNGDVELCNGNTCSESDLGTISKVELRVHGYYSGIQHDIILRPVFSGEFDGEDYTYQTTSEADWSEWFDITNDGKAPETWDWDDVKDLDCDVETENDASRFTLYCSKVEIRVIYNAGPEISDPYPPSGSIGISLTPILNITVYSGEEIMNISWLSNSSGSWVVFGTNNSVYSDTYHQTFSNASENGKWWYWKVNVTDGTNTVESSVYKFYTGCETKIENTGSTNISGYLLMQVQYYSDLLEDWVVVDDTINEDTSRTISAGEYLALDTIFNGLVNSSKLRYGNGTYRVYVAFRDPNGNVLMCDDETLLEIGYAFSFSRPLYDWINLATGGFGSVTNRATRGIEIYNGELYVGTENWNKTRFWENIPENIGCNGFLAGTRIKMADGSYKNIEDIKVDDQVKAYNTDNNSYVTANVTEVYWFSYEAVPDHYVTINNKLHISPNHLLYVNGTLTNASDVVTGDFLVDVNGSNVTVNSSEQEFEKKKMYNFVVSVNPEVNAIQENLTYFAEDIQVYPLGFNGSQLHGDLLLALLHRVFVNKAIRWVLREIAEASDGCEVWKYNYTTNTWTDLVGRNVTGEANLSSGFGDTRNWCVAKMKVFNGKLYVSTWQSPDVGGEIWRYDGFTWEQVVGPNATMKGGFNNTDNMALSCMEVFENSSGVTHLYVGTSNLDRSCYGGCQVWRTEDGETWEQVVDRGFRDHGAGLFTKNAYAWCMEVFNDSLYVGTFNSGVDWGCQLWRTVTGDAGGDDWEKVMLPKNNETGEFKDGFGEAQNYGIRGLVNYSGNLYVGTATSVAQLYYPGCEIEAIELWKYDGTEGWDAWECIIGDNSGKTGDWDDGFGDYFNKYCWSMTVCGDELWAGTFNLQLDCDPFDYDSKGCEVWRYDGVNLTASVKNGGEIGNGFGNKYMMGARSMIEFPAGSGNLVAGTYTIKALRPKVEELGCEVWIRYP